MMQPNTVLLHKLFEHFRKRHESGVKAGDLSASDDRGISAELEDPAPRGR